MTQKIIEYKIVKIYNRADNREALVNNEVALGWQPFQQPYAYDGFLYQTMVKYEDEIDEPTKASIIRLKKGNEEYLRRISYGEFPTLDEQSLTDIQNAIDRLNSLSAVKLSEDFVDKYMSKIKAEQEIKEIREGKRPTIFSSTSTQNRGYGLNPDTAVTYPDNE